MSALFSAFNSHIESSDVPAQTTFSPTADRLIPRAEKDADDPSSSATSTDTLHRRGSTTLTTLSRLFAQSSASPGLHRNASSYTQMPETLAQGHERSTAGESPSLTDHLLTRGLGEGRHSDITIKAFGKPYKLHRLILDRAPFFESALSKKWLESDAEELSIRPEDVDPSITQRSFELALRRLYGSIDTLGEESESISMFATGCWLEMQDLIRCSVDSILRQMAPDDLSLLICFVTNNYYGKHGERILASAKAMLCRDGWRMPARFWDGVPAHVVCEVVGGDGLFVNGEWDRWILAKSILNRRLKKLAFTAGLVGTNNPQKLRRAPMAIASVAIRPGITVEPSKKQLSDPSGMQSKYFSLYNQVEMGPLLSLLDEEIHYVHMEFEQLQIIRQTRDVLGFPMVHGDVISKALWHQMEFRQKILNAPETDLELGLSHQVPQSNTSGTSPGDRETGSTVNSAQTGNVKSVMPEATHIPRTDSSDQNPGGYHEEPQRHWIPASDSNIVIGGSSEPFVATSRSQGVQGDKKLHAVSAHTDDSPVIVDSSAANRPIRHPEEAHEQSVLSYSAYPPFRFAAEFPDPRTLKERKRVYSRTLFYAGSYWNIYIQKINSSRSRQLGIYLHRAKDQASDDVIAGTAGLSSGHVDERIGRLEREMLRRNGRREPHSTPTTDDVADGGSPDRSLASHDVENSPTEVPSANPASNTRRSSMRNLLSRDWRRPGLTSFVSPPRTVPADGTSDSESNDDDNDDDGDDNPRAPPSAPLSTSIRTLPAYIDRRPTIRAYFKIFSPSRGGRMLSIYESVPDKFDFSQAWGWKSSTLTLDDGVPTDDFAEHVFDADYNGQSTDQDPAAPLGFRSTADGRLRFMVVIGVI